jgi:uncharacterized alkaline shock family protein YloU
VRHLEPDEKTDNNIGGLVISDEVIASIALNAAKDVDGVAGFASRPPDMHSILKTGESAFKSVKVWAGDNDIKLQLYIIIKDNKKIPTIAAEVQRNVKNAVQSMTGRVVTKVNISISGIDFKEPSADKS